MDKKVKVFLSCLLIAIPAAAAVASLFVQQPKQSVKGIAVTKAIVPTQQLSPTPTLFILQQPASTSAKKTQIATTLSITATPSATAKIELTKEKHPEVQITSTTASSSAKLAQSDVISPTPTLFVTPQPTIPANQPTSAPATSAIIVDQPSSSIVLPSFGFPSTRE